MKFLVTGVNGMLGHDVYTHIEEQGYEVLGLGKEDVASWGIHNYRKCNLLDFFAVNQLICEFQPNVVIHCAAFTDVNAAEKSFSQPTNNNVLATKWLAQACDAMNVHMIFISTDYVFEDADMSILRYPGDNKGTALNRYGDTKSKAEDEVMACMRKWTIVRTSGLFGLHGKNFIKTIARQAQKGRDLWVVNDNKCRPTYTKDLAQALLTLAVENKEGIYHITNEGEYVSWYDIAKEVIENGGWDIQLSTRSSDDDLVKRIKNSQLICNIDVPLPEWKDAVRRYMKEMEYFTDNEDRE